VSFDRNFFKFDIQIHTKGCVINCTLHPVEDINNVLGPHRLHGLINCLQIHIYLLPLFFLYEFNNLKKSYQVYRANVPVKMTVFRAITGTMVFIEI
jgi:hypothetical protein